MARFPEAEARLFRGKFVCKSCKTVVKAPQLDVIQGKVACKQCGSKALRPKRKK